MEAAVAGQSALYLWVLVGSIIVHDQMQLTVLGVAALRSRRNLNHS